MSYDDWKLRAPEDEPGYYSGDYDDEPEDDCCHEDYEADILTGRATCNMCGHHWYQTEEEIARKQRRKAEYAKWQRQQWRRERLTRLWRWLWPFRRKPKPEPIVDDVPF